MTMGEAKRVILVTGSSGYVGSMIVDRLLEESRADMVIGIDINAKPELLKKHNKYIHIQKMLADLDFSELEKYKIDAVIHTAWQIREMYGKNNNQYRLNIESSRAIFNYVLNNRNIKKLIYFSTVASYGALPTNTHDQIFTEESPLRKCGFRYADEKNDAEAILSDFFSDKQHDTNIAIIRPVSITGPKGRFMRDSFGLQSVLSGRLKKEGFINKLLSVMTVFIPLTPKWCRQFVHEDDIYGMVIALLNENRGRALNIYNACPEGEIVTGEKMAEIVGKKKIILHPQIIRLAFSVIWHLLRGRIPVSPGGWKTYSFPIVVDGSKITKDLGYRYLFDTVSAFRKDDGYYKKYI